MAAHIEDILLTAISQTGDRYVFGAENKPTDPDPTRHDCSELVEWASARCGLTAPDGAYNQWKWTKNAGLAIPVAEGIATRGALLFTGDGTGTGRDAITHVAWSLGDGSTIEARGAKWGVGTWQAAGRFQFAGLMPGVDYSPGHGRLDPQPSPTNTGRRKVLFIIRADGSFDHWLTDGITKRHLVDQADIDRWRFTLGANLHNGGTAIVWPKAAIDAIPIAG